MRPSKPFSFDAPFSSVAPNPVEQLFAIGERLRILLVRVELLSVRH